jgi:hypothetical protein
MDNAVLVDAPDGVRGFDCNTALTADLARRFFDHGYRFAVRYIRRSQLHNYDLSASEAIAILDGGLALMAVQHVESAESWVPTAQKGATFGATAVGDAQRIGLPAGTMVWCDLEGVKVGTPTADTIEYCNTWHRAVEAGGYLPGLYIGWHAGLSGDQLYQRLRFQRYWSAYNLDADRHPAVRGVCMRQRAAKGGDRPTGVPFEIDTDITYTDSLGGKARVLARTGWLDTCGGVR